MYISSDSDSEALKIKFTDQKIFIKNEPQGSVSKALYAIAEKIRYEKIGSDKLKGVKINLKQCYENRFKHKKVEEIITKSDVPITEAFELYLRTYFFKIKQNNTTQKIDISNLSKGIYFISVDDNKIIKKVVKQ